MRFFFIPGQLSSHQSVLFANALYSVVARLAIVFGTKK